MQAGLRKGQRPPLIVSEATLICICWTYGHRFWHSSPLSFPTGCGDMGVRLHETKIRASKKAGSTPLAVLPWRSEWPAEFGASPLPTSFSSSFTHTPSKWKHTHTPHLISFHRQHDIKSTELQLFDIQADNRTALLSNTWTIGKKCGFHKWVNLQLAVQEINHYPQSIISLWSMSPVTKG